MDRVPTVICPVGKVTQFGEYAREVGFNPVVETTPFLRLTTEQTEQLLAQSEASNSLFIFAYEHRAELRGLRDRMTRVDDFERFKELLDRFNSAQ